MNEKESDLLNWAYALTQHFEDFEGEPYNDYKMESVWHDYSANGDGEIHVIYVGVELDVSDEDYETNPLALISRISNAGFELYSTNVVWDRRNLRLTFKYDL